MDTESVGPFESHESLVANLRSYRRCCARLRSYEIAELWDRDELAFIMDLFDSGDAYALV